MALPFKRYFWRYGWLLVTSFLLFVIYTMSFRSPTAGATYVKQVSGDGQYNGDSATFMGRPKDQRPALNTDLPSAQRRGFKLLPGPDMKSSCGIQANIRENMDHLEKTTQGDWHWQWIMKRIKSLWPQWVKAAKTLEAKRPSFTNRKLKKIMIVPGVLTQTPFARPDKIKLGSPLGDLLQWADLIAGLHVLGHTVDLHHNLYTASSHLLRNDFRGGPGECYQTPFHSIFIDIIGLKKFSPDIQGSFQCKYRVIDAYGTHAMFNDRQYSSTHRYNSGYGNLGLNLKQFYTFYPHTPDNSFLGFVVQPSQEKHIKKPIALLYGKDPKYWNNKNAYIQEFIKMNISVHATIPKKSFLPSEVVFHNVVDSTTYQKLLRESKFLLAAGLPLESSGVIEALGHGAVIVQPQYKGEQLNILRGKPTTRKLTSQVPYLEEFIGPPHAYTVDITDTEAIRNVIEEALKTEAEPFVPEEFTIVGYLDRLHSYLENQDFCNKESPLWPPLKALLAVEGQMGESCSEACVRKGKANNKTAICEPVYFKHINTAEYISKNMQTNSEDVKFESDVFYPAMDMEKQIILQKKDILFSCAGSAKHLNRICPCRYALKHQVALCEDCMDREGSPSTATLTSR